MKNALERPTVLTPEARATIVRCLAEAGYLKTACAAAGLSYSGLRHWQRRWEEGDPHAQRFADFFKALQKAVSAGECAALRTVRAGGPGWQGSAWFLGRRFPERWGRKDRRGRRGRIGPGTAQN